jgi:hypothetical protein
MTTAEIEELFVTLLTGAVGGSADSWRKAVGPVTALPIVFHPRSNWTIAPKGSKKQLEAIGKAEAIIRLEHPYVPSPKTLDPPR